MNPRAPAVLVIGDVMLDIVAAPERAIALGTDTPATISLLPGGSGANQAAWLAHFGNAVRFAGRVGMDGAAEHAAALRAHGVEPFFARDELLRTGVLVALIGANGERSFLTDRGANARLERRDLPDRLLEGVDHVHVSGYALHGPGPRAAVLDFLSIATARGIPFSVDSASSAVLDEISPKAFLECTRAAALCFLNAAEAAVLTASTDRSEQLSILGANFETVIITCGASGAHAAAAYGTERRSVEAANVAALDTSGAGDAFLAGFLSAHLRGERVERCLQDGVRAGSSAVLHYGGRPASAQQTRELAASVAMKSRTTDAG